MTDPDDDPQLRWDPETLSGAAQGTEATAPNGWVRAPAAPAAPATPVDGPPQPRPIDWGRATGPTPGERELLPPLDEPPSRSTSAGSAPRHRRRRKKERDRVRSLVEWVAVIVGALVVALVVKTFLFQAFYIPSASMEPTLEKGDRVLVNKLSYDLHDINRGDIVVFERPDDWQPALDDIEDLIKRAVGLPGELVELRAGDVFIDGERLDEPYLPDGTSTEPGASRATRWEVPEDHIFVMGDNRDNSADSRFYADGFVPIDSVVGRAFVQVWPPTDVGGL